MVGDIIDSNYVYNTYVVIFGLSIFVYISILISLKSANEYIVIFIMPLFVT